MCKLLQKIKEEALEVIGGAELNFSPGKLHVCAKLHAMSFHSLQALDRKR